MNWRFWRWRVVDVDALADANVAMGTNPDTLTPEQLRLYVRQLQRTCLMWQRKYASTAGLTRDEMIRRFK